MDVEFIKRVNSHIDKVEMFEKIDSTNLYALRTLDNELNRLIVASNQSAGQGRFNHKFYSYSDCGLYFTLDLSKNIVNEKNVMMKMALAIVTVINQQYDKNLKIKWVNDIYEGNKKVGGILIQNTDKKLIIGVGINLYEPKEGYDLAIQNKAKALFNEKINHLNLLADIIDNFFVEVTADDLVIKYKHYSLVLNKMIYHYQYKKELYVEDITTEGNLIAVDIENNEYTINSGQIKVRSF